MTFKPGDEVLCVASAAKIARCKAVYPWATFPEHRGVYVVRGAYGQAERRLLLLVGITHGPCEEGLEWGFDEKYFRTVLKRKRDTDISELTSLLNSIPSREKVE